MVTAADTSWVRFDPAKKETWPPANTLALLYDQRWGDSLGSWQPDSERPEGGAWYDENGDLDDEWEVDDERWWRPLPLRPGGSG